MRISRFETARSMALVGITLMLASGCSGNLELATAGAGGTHQTATGTGGQGGSGSGGGGAAGSGVGTAGSGQGGGLVVDAGPGDAGPFAECAKATSEAELLPLDVYVMLDQSGSMIGAKWTAVSSAIHSFASDPTVADLGVGLQYFPLPLAKVCDLTAYAVPEVPIAPLSGNAGALDASLKQHQPADNTPTLPALQGALQYAKTWAKDHPTHTVAVVLATDGAPDGCGSDVAKVAQAATLGATLEPKIRTFVIGVGAELSALDAVAAAGGTDKALLVDSSSQTTAAQFAAALASIRGSALPCKYALPAPDAGTIDHGKVNVLWTPSEGAAVVLSKVAGPNACNPGASEWYYDDDANPSAVILCDSLCSTVKAGGKGRVDVVLGCVTKVAS